MGGDRAKYPVSVPEIRPSISCQKLRRINYQRFFSSPIFIGFFSLFQIFVWEKDKEHKIQIETQSTSSDMEYAKYISKKNISNTNNLLFQWFSSIKPLAEDMERRIHPVDTQRKMSVYKKFKLRPRRLLRVLCTFN